MDKVGHMVWLDTINFVKGLTGAKVKAAEIIANYVIGKKYKLKLAKNCPWRRPPSWRP